MSTRPDQIPPPQEARRQAEGGFGIQRYINPVLSKLQITGHPEEGLAGAIAQMWEAKGNPHWSNKERQDAWKMYLTQPQENGSIHPSRYSPTISQEEDAEYYTLPGFLQEFAAKVGIDELLKRIAPDGGTVLSPAEMVGGGSKTYDQSTVFGKAKFSQGHDEKGHYISIYDKYDFDVPMEREGHGLGKPFEIYDRVYYDPQTFAIISENR